MADAALTIKAMRPVVPARDFEISKRFYSELGFRPQTLAGRLVEMHFGGYSFILQDYYVEECATNFVMHVSVADLDYWWKHICGLDLTSRYGVKVGAPKLESWGTVAGLIDPSGVLWRFSQSPSDAQAEISS
jgi:hypothetical protein